LLKLPDDFEGNSELRWRHRPPHRHGREPECRAQTAEKAEEEAPQADSASVHVRVRECACEGEEAEDVEEAVKRIRRFLLRSVVVVLSLVVGLATAVLAVRMVPPLELASGGTEGTPVQIVAFLTAFLFGTALSLIFGMEWLERHFRRGL